MLIGNIYSITGLVSACVCFAILSSNNRIYEKDNVIRSYFSFLLINLIFCNLVDSLWGFMNTRAFYIGRTAFVVVSFLIHLTVIFSVACWCIFVTCYFGFKESRLIMILQCIPLAAAVALLISQLAMDTVFVIDEAGNYSSGPLRSCIFYIQYSYYIIAFLKVAYFLIKNHKQLGLRYKLLVLGCTIIPTGFAVLQYFYPDAPYTILGFMFSVVVVFNGMMVIEKHRRSHRFETISKESYMTLEAVSFGYEALALIDIITGKYNVIKSTPYADSVIDTKMPIRDLLLKVFVDAAEPEFKEEMEGFIDLSTLPVRMVNRRTVSMQYRSQGIGWSIVSFIAADRDETRRLKKVVLSLQSIDEHKKKEQEYEDALSRAYRNENAVLAELIKMQSVGVVASDEDRKVLVANDVILEMFGRTGIDPVGMDVFELWNSKDFSFTDEIKEEYYRIEKEGGEFTYETECAPEDEEVRYYKADAKRVDLLDGSKVMVTCYTDITQSKHLEEQLRMLSETDSLTRIPNRRCGESQIKLLMEEGIPGIYCLLDIDGFKKINDTLGHQAGDDTIVAVANAIKASFRSNDIFMRLGGDEFAIYMRGVVKPELARIRIARLFENIARIELDSVPKGSISISLGAVIVRDRDGVIDEDYISVYKRADAEMYKCKGRTGSSMSIEEGTGNEES
ncbi:MAG: sensor domain-containing diguanylate cyclase [Lachnospiraceae bacterium]|nr:sensor domain-containing diguanylate cyclase [Lachnospiraceae bacterium]